MVAGPPETRTLPGILNLQRQGPGGPSQFEGQAVGESVHHGLERA